MIKSTPKADTLPDDLRKHWEEAMADKFPISVEEALAWVQNHYGDKVRLYIAGHGIEVSYTHRVQIPDGSDPRQWVNKGYYVQRFEDPSYMRYRTEAILEDRITLRDFRLSSMKEKIDAMLKDD
jgi:hypothetical protein